MIFSHNTILVTTPAFHPQNTPIRKMSLIQMAARRALVRSMHELRSSKQLNVPIRQRQQPHRLSSSDTSGQTKNETHHNDKNEISVTFSRPDGSKTTVRTTENKTLYDAVIDNNVDLDGFGACEGTLCCTTCHLIFKQSDFEKVGGPSDEELDMLDLAYGLTDTSRLGCQVVLKKEFDPLEVKVPESINDVRV